MGSVSIENGKRIQELLEVSQIHADSYFLVSETDLTRKITLQNLRNTFNGDSATENLNNVYYSVEKINELLNHAYDEINKINTKIDNIQDRLDTIYNDIGADLSEFKKYVGQIYEDLKLADTNLSIKIDNTKQELNTKITEVNNKLDARLKIVENKLRNVTDIQVGTSIPDTLPSGVVYLQYF